MKRITVHRVLIEKRVHGGSDEKKTVHQGSDEKNNSS